MSGLFHAPHRRRQAPTVTQLLVLDTFTGPDETLINARPPDIDVVGSGWDSHSTIKLRSNMVYVDASNTTRTAIIDTGQSDVDVSMVMQFPDFSHHGIMFRTANGSNDYIRCQMRVGGQIRIISDTTDYVTTDVPADPLAFYLIRIVANGSLVTAFFDGAQIWSGIIEENLDVTVHGFYMRSRNFSADDFTVNALN